jgi:hypothetical protein
VVTEGHVIGGFPKYPNSAEGFAGRTLAAAELHVIRDHGLLAWLGLVAQRMGWMLAVVRPYFSAAHNACMATAFLLYPFAIAAIYRLRNHPVAHLLLAVIVLNVLITGLTFAEWNGRFLVPVLPLMIALAATAVPDLARRT